MSARLEARLPQPETRPAIVVVPAEGDGPRFRILTRVSDDKLRSIPQQVKECADYLRTLPSPPVVDGLYNVGEHSGFSMGESHVYRQLLEDARNGLFQGLVVRDSSRLGRDYWEKLGTLRDLRAAGVEFHVVEDGGRFDFDDRLQKVRSWASTWADEEKKREEIRKALRATEALREQGLPTVKPPLGYKTVKDPRLGRRVWRPDADAPKVQALFALLREQPVVSLAQAAREAGLTPKQAERAARNRAYTGGFVWKGVFHPCAPEVVPPLVGPEAFAAAQERLDGR